MNPVSGNVITAVTTVFDIVILTVVVRCFLSFFPNVPDRHPVVQFLRQVTDPIMRPFQRMIPSMAGLDFSPILAILTLRVGEQLLVGLLMGILPR